ncbi:MAG: class I SAM-dependent methyltransferase [Planctomycetes bacterium]|nr:class I SAM-dependent methyltransferase [Planctomycetota bacterium]
MRETKRILVLAEGAQYRDAARAVSARFAGQVAVLPEGVAFEQALVQWRASRVGEPDSHARGDSRGDSRSRGGCRGDSRGDCSSRGDCRGDCRGDAVGEHTLAVRVGADGMSLIDLEPPHRCLRVDFAQPRLLRRLRGCAGREPLVHALRGKAARATTVLDATAGLGVDTAIAASRGLRVIAVERHAVLAALLRDGLSRASLDERTRSIAERITLMEADATAVLRDLGAANEPCVAYLDPMFADAAHKSALPSGAMQLVRALLHQEGASPQAENVADLLEAARAAAPRVVVKRPRTAPPLAGSAPHHSVRERTCRFDVYVR